MPRRLRAARRPLIPIALAGAVLVVCAACTPTPAPVPTDIATTAPTTAPTPEAPVLQPDGSAEDNLPFFTTTIVSAAAGGAGGDGRAYVDALVAAGFEKSAMELTPDLTTIGNPAESIEFSVRWGEQCLVGQVGPAIGDPRTQVLSGLAEGRCLIGNTRAIDW